MKLKMFKKITKFEKTRIIGTRATHLSNGAEPKIDIGDMESVIEIAQKEYELGKIPIIIVRKYPNRVEEVKFYK